MKFLQAYQSGNLVLPAALLFHFKEIFPQADDFLVWQFFYLQNTTQHHDILPSKIAEALGKQVSDVNASISRLTAQGLLNTKTIELDGEIEIIFDASPALERLDQFFLNSSSGVSQKTSSSKSQSLEEFKALADDFASEFGRMLSSFELEDLRKTVIDEEMSADLVREALREAVFNGKLNFKYINAILRNWRQEGILTLRQVEERRLERDKANPRNVQVSDDFLNAMDLWSN